MADKSVIELQVEKVGQLFDTLDPLPFRERDLDREAEEYIVNWARELPRNIPIDIMVHLPAAEASSDQGRDLGQALSRYFRYRAEVASNDLKELFRIGRYALFVGLGVLVICIAVGRFLTSALVTGGLGAIFSEGLIILGWVANWRPIEIFLFDWWPIVRRRNLYKKLAAADVILVPR